MLQYLINSKTRLAILGFLLKDPTKSFYAREIVNQLDLDPANVHKELANLLKGKFISVELKEEKKYFSMNTSSQFFNGLKELFSAAGNEYQEFVCLEEMLNYYPMMATLPWNTFLANDFFKQSGIKHKFTSLLTVFKDNLCQLYVNRREFRAAGMEILDKLKKNPDWGKEYIVDLKDKETNLYEASNKLQFLNLKKFSDKELLMVYTDYYDIYTKLHIKHWIQTALDFDENIFSKYLMGYLKEKIKGTAYSLGDVFSVLTTPTEEAKAAEEYRNLLSILNEIIKDKKLEIFFADTETRIIVKELPRISPKINLRIKKHADQFGFLGYGTVGPAWDMTYFIDILSSLVRQNSDPVKLLAETESNRRHIKTRQVQLERDLKIDSHHCRIFHFARQLVFTKGTRKDSMFHSYSVIENLYKEIGRRRYLSLRQVRYLHPHEIKKVLTSDKFPASLLNERYKLSLNYSTGRYEEDLNLTGEKADQFIGSLNIIKERTENVKILYGDCASPGRVRGEVKIINEPKDVEKMNKGDILVSLATTPDLVPAIKKAAAIVTDAGGITCHAAIISRELGIPCVVGTKIATKVLRDHDIIDVNAAHGKVDVIKKNNKYDKKRN